MQDPKQRIDILEQESLDFKSSIEKKDLETMKEGVIQKMKQQRSKPKKTYVWKTAAAAAAITLLLPSSIYAGGKLYEYYQSKVKQKGYHVEIDVQKKTEEDAKKLGKVLAVKEPKNVKLDMKNLKGYTVQQNDQGNYDFDHEDGFESGKNFSCELIRVDQTIRKSFFIDDVASWKEKDLGGKKGIYIKRNDIVGSQYHQNTTYTQRFLVFYEKEGYILQFYAQNSLKEDTLVQYAANITLKSTNHMKKRDYINLSQYVKQKKADNDEISEKIPKNKIISQKQQVIRNGIQYQVQKVKIGDIVPNDKQSFSENGWECRQKYADDDGKLKSYVRETIEEGDGYKKPEAKVIGTKKVALKFVQVDLKVKNTTKQEEEVQISQVMNFLKKDGKNYVLNSNFRRPDAVEKGQIDSMAQYFKETNGGTGFYLKKLKAGEEKIYHIGYFVDEDLVSQMHLLIGDGVAPKNTFDGWEIMLSK